MRRLICCVEEFVSARKTRAFCVRGVSPLSRSRPSSLGFALLVALIAIPGGELFAQRGVAIPFFSDYATNLTANVGGSIGAVPTATIPFSLNDASPNVRILGADPYLPASLGITSGGLASGYYFDLLADQIALRRLLPPSPSGLPGNPALLDFYINPVSPFVSGWIPGPGDSALEDRLAQTQRGELLPPQSSSNLSSEGTINPNQNLFSRRIAQSIVLPAPAATEQNNEAELELETVPDTDEKVSAVFPPAPRALAARGVNTRFADSLEPFSALRFAMRSWTSMPLTLLRPGELGWEAGEIAGDDRGVPPEFTVPAAIESGAMVAEASVAVPASRQPMLRETVAAVATHSSSPPANSQPVTAPSAVGEAVAAVAEEVASVPSVVAVAEASRPSSVAGSPAPSTPVASPKPPTPASTSLLDPAVFHSLASSEDALALALAGGPAAPIEKLVAATQSAGRENVPTRVAATRSAATAASVARIASASPNASTERRSRYDFEGSTAAIDRLLVANSHVNPAAPPRRSVVSKPAPATAATLAPATVVARKPNLSPFSSQPNSKPRPFPSSAAVVAARAQPARGASTSGSNSAVARQAGAGQVGAGYVNSTHGRPIYNSVTYYDGYGRVIDGGVYGGVPRTSQPPSLMTDPTGARPVKSFAQWRKEQLAEANRLLAAGERARLSGKPNTAWRYFQQAEQIRDTVAGLP